MTSNVGARLITERQGSLGFAREESAAGDFEKIKSTVMGELKNLFKPEFLNRVDDIIVFHKLTKEDTVKIAGKLLGTLSGKLTELGVEVEFTPEAVELIAEKGYDPGYGARPLRRAVQRELEDVISERLLEGTMAAGKKYRCGVSEGGFRLEEC